MRTTTLAVFGLALLIGAPRPGGPAGPPAPRFQIAFLRQDWQGLGLGSDWETAWPRLQEAAGDPLLRFDERDVAAYDPEGPRIVLRPEAGPRLLDALRPLPGLPERLRKLP